MPYAIIARHFHFTQCRYQENNIATTRFDVSDSLTWSSFSEKPLSHSSVVTNMPEGIDDQSNCQSRQNAPRSDHNAVERHHRVSRVDGDGQSVSRNDHRLVIAESQAVGDHGGVTGIR
eukprot:469351_1